MMALSLSHRKIQITANSLCLMMAIRLSRHINKFALVCHVHDEVFIADLALHSYVTSRWRRYVYNVQHGRNVYDSFAMNTMGELRIKSSVTSDNDKHKIICSNVTLKNCSNYIP